MAPSTFLSVSPEKLGSLPYGRIRVRCPSTTRQLGTSSPEKGAEEHACRSRT